MTRANPSVNRYHSDKALDRIDHALGRPLWPLRETYRNHYATDATGPLAIEFGWSAHWEWLGQSGDMAFFAVTDAGRQALHDHLAREERPWRGWLVTFEGITTTIPARSAGKAKYALFLEISDSFSELVFGEFARGTTARPAP